MQAYEDIHYESHDGLRLYARDYRHDAPRGTVLCLHGLTRNSADFGKVCVSLNDEYRIIAVDQRGRGRSDRDPQPSNYNALTYARDMFDLLDGIGIDQVFAIGTSMGGIISMVMGSMASARFRGVVLNDVGPVIDPAGLDRIRNYVGKLAAVQTWADAAAQVRATNALAFPDYGPEDWEAFARNLYREDDDGVPTPAYDPAIAESLRVDENAAPPPELWPAFDALADIPLLVVRGATSDILAPTCVVEMTRRRPDITVVEVPNRGHAPMLDEPVACTAVRRFLDDATST